MAIVAHNEKEVKLLARLMRAEAEGEGELGMLMVGNVGINRVIAKCSDFQQIRTIEQMVFQRPGGFESTLKSYFYQADISPKAHLDTLKATLLPYYPHSQQQIPLYPLMQLIH